MKKIHYKKLEAINGGISPRDCFGAGFLHSYSVIGRYLGGIHAVNATIIDGVAKYCKTH